MRGCTKVSPGCKFCYAETLAERFRGVPGHPFEQGFDLRLVPDKLEQPLRWRRPRKIFVNSMSDLFHEDIPVEYISRVGDVMRRASWHLFQVLTKRHERMRALLAGELRWMADLPNIAYGVSVEDQRHGLPRLRALQETSARIRFLSIEPLLEDLGALDLRGIEWVIVGGESGPHARPMLRSWVVPIRRACRAQRVPFFSSNGVACANTRPGERSTVARTMSSRWRFSSFRSRATCMAKQSDPNPAHWEQYGPFQHVKHDLVRCYLNGWYPKLGSWAGRVLYVDTHAGRGRFETGDPGSPVGEGEPTPTTVVGGRRQRHEPAQKRRTPSTRTAFGAFGVWAVVGSSRRSTNTDKILT